MSIKSFLQEAKSSINKYAYLHWGIRIFTGTISSSYYKNLKKNLEELNNQAQNSSIKFPVSGLYPCYEDKKDAAGKLMMHYFFQDIYVAQQIHKNNPLRHIDIGSRVDGFVAHVATFREIEVFDIRPLNISVPNIKFTQADLMNLNEKDIASTDSVSCLHALEHFGLGRYGDPIKYDGYLDGFRNITALLKKEGKLYFSVPMGVQRIEFHAHRVFSLNYLLQIVSEHFTIDNFSYINDNNEFFPKVDLSTVSVKDKDESFGCKFGCGIFVLTKK
ncbi:MAG TPA: DUF268 domain-containing protein [Paludibacter sp.]